MLEIRRRTFSFRPGHYSGESWKLPIKANCARWSKCDTRAGQLGRLNDGMQKFDLDYFLYGPCAARN